MRFISAYQSVELLVSDIEGLLKSDKLDRDDILLICLESQRSNIARMLDIPIETVREDDEQNVNPLDAYELDDASYDLYDSLILKGGYVLLGRKDKVDDSLVRKSVDVQKHTNMHAPGFGAEQEVPKKVE